METDVTQSPVVSFRPVKRQKYMRKRADEPDDVLIANQATGEQEEASSTHDVSQRHASDGNEPTDDLSDVMRLRKPRRLRKGGIEFSTSKKQELNQSNQLESTAENTEMDTIRARFDRFTAYTGQKVDVDKHMMEYIESKLAKRQNHGHEGEKSAATDRSDPPDSNHSFSHSFSRREPAALGKLHEIDLGQDAKLQNIARTEAATRLMAGDSSLSASPLEKPRVGKDGPAWRNRMRSHEDLERDRLVDEVLRESKLDVYDEPEQDLSLDDQAADDRIAEQFRRDFMEAIQSRRRTMRTRPNNSKVAKPDVPRGPKLGGSRSARAAMREMQEKAKKKPA